MCFGKCYIYKESKPRFFGRLFNVLDFVLNEKNVYLFFIRFKNIFLIVKSKNKIKCVKS